MAKTIQDILDLIKENGIKNWLIKPLTVDNHGVRVYEI